MSFPPTMTFHDSPVLWLSDSFFQNFTRLRMLPTLEPRGQLSGMQELGGGGEKMLGLDGNNSRGRVLTPLPTEHSHPFSGDKASVPSIHSPQLIPHPPTKSSPPHQLLSLSEGLRWRGSPLTPSWPHCFTPQLSHPQPKARAGKRTRQLITITTQSVSCEAGLLHRLPAGPTQGNLHQPRTRF